MRKRRTHTEAEKNQQEIRRKARQHRNKLARQREDRAQTRDAEFWEAYKVVCKKYRRYLGELTPSHCVVSVSSVEVVGKRLDESSLYIYSRE